ncbi:MAG TPA: hypothetical protein VGR55_06210 [Candidatus Acidoferrum sp.]|nr:hypothetical protein [Candidatus Acidoferrum sp.]
MAAAQDEVYEAVVRDIITPSDGRIRVTQLVFDEMVLTPSGYENESSSCEAQARKQIWLENAKLPYDSLADKAYRFFTRDSYDDTLKPDTIKDFLKKFCTPGQLSRTFHTDLPRSFVGDERFDFGGGLILPRKGEPPAKRFPGAGGRISFSRVGFDSHLDEAIVATSFVCGWLCGSGDRYVLRKRQGRWEVVNKWMVWVS